MQMCADDKDLKSEDAVDAVLFSTCTQHRLRLDIQLDLEGGGGDGFVHRLVSDCVLKLFYTTVVVVTAEKEVAGLLVVALRVIEGQRGRSNNTVEVLAGADRAVQFQRGCDYLARCREFCLSSSQMEEITREEEQGCRHLCSPFITLVKRLSVWFWEKL